MLLKFHVPIGRHFFLSCSVETSNRFWLGGGGGIGWPAAMTKAVAEGVVLGPEAFARDHAMMAWLRGEFAAANAMIDALCEHLAQIGEREEYEAVFAAVHRRRLNWIPVLQMQCYYPVSDVVAELRAVASNLLEDKEKAEEELDGATAEPIDYDAEIGVRKDVTEVDSAGDFSDQKGAKDGSQEDQSSLDKFKIYTDHKDCLARPESTKILKGFVAKESVKGHMVNIVKGLKLYEDIFADSELLKLAEFVAELRLAGRKGKLSGETFICFNKEMKGNRREIIQLGVPLFQSTSETTGNIESIPPAIQAVIEHLVQWRLIPERRKPNSCIINFFDEDEHSQPYCKPPHLENPISTLFLSKTTVAFGRSIVSDHEGNFKGSLALPIEQGSLLVMRGNSADMARHVVCPSANRRVIVTFLKVRSSDHPAESPISLRPTKTMALLPPPQMLQAAGVIAYTPPGMIPAAASPAAWGMAFHRPIVMLPPPQPMGGGGGTGVFLPWPVAPKKQDKHLPPRIQRRRLLSLPPSPLESHA